MARRSKHSWPVSPFEFPLLARLQWAERELDRLNDAGQTFLQDQAVTTVSKPNADATEYIVSVKKGVKRVPDEIAFRIGAVAHLTRTTLDWLAWSMSRCPCDDTLFPIWSRKQHTPQGRVEHPGIPGGLCYDAKQLVKRVQPYVTHDADPTASPLHWLKELDNIDKHRHLLPVACSDSGSFARSPAVGAGRAAPKTSGQH